jgi:hypothetical protein
MRSASSQQIKFFSLSGRANPRYADILQHKKLSAELCPLLGDFGVLYG